MTQIATRSMGSPQGPAGEAIALLAYAAAPVFGVMAGLSALNASGMAICSGAAMLPIHDMALMYLLMALFHLSPWLKLLFAQRHDTDLSQTQGD